MYNVLDEKWIPVTGLDDCRHDVSLRDVILNAHEYKELAEADSILECAIYRFLFTFVSDMVFTEYDTDDEIIDVTEDLFARGNFSSEIFESYIDLCREEGTSFDLFDNDRPFMQNGQYPYTEEDIVSVAKLCQRAASGTNKLFQCHTNEKDTSVMLPEAVRLLLAQSPFNTPGGSGWGSNHFGAYPPLFTYVMGQTLYETIVFNLFKNEGEDRVDHKPFWRMSLANVEKNTTAPSFSRYASMHYPWRFTKLIPTSEGNVKSMYYTPGYKIEKTRPDILRDPFATYILNKKDECYLLCPKDSDLAWKNISGIFDQRSAPIIVNKYRALKEELDLDNINVVAYVTIVKDVHGTFTGAWKNKVLLPSTVLDPSSQTLDYMYAAIEYADKKLASLRNASEKAIGKEDFKSMKSGMESRFNSICRNGFFNVFLPALSGTEKDVLEQWQDTVQQITIDLYDSIVIESLSNMEKIRNAFYQRRFLFDKKE